jgi:hypothetical protein
LFGFITILWIYLGKMDTRMTMTALVTILILGGCGYTINSKDATTESRTSAYGLIMLVVGWYAPSPVTAMAKRLNDDPDNAIK